MAVTNRVQLDYNPRLGREGAAAASRYLVSESQTATSPALGSDVTSTAVVPADKFWVLRSVRAVNTDGSARDVQIRVLDADGTIHAVLADGVTPVSVPAGSALAYTHPVFLPAGWQVQVLWKALAANVSVDWQYIALELNADTLYEQDLLA